MMCCRNDGVVAIAVMSSRWCVVAMMSQTELSRFLREHARSIEGKQQLVITAVAKALEVVPRQLAENAGFDSTDVLNKLRQKHAAGDEDPACKWFGVNCDVEGICNTLEAQLKTRTFLVGQRLMIETSPLPLGGG